MRAYRQPTLPGKIANHFLTDDAFSEKLAGNLEKSMPKRRLSFVWFQGVLEGFIRAWQV